MFLEVVVMHAVLILKTKCNRVSQKAQQNYNENLSKVESKVHVFALTSTFSAVHSVRSVATP